MKRLTVNLAPADLPKAGPAYDPPTTIELLLATKQGCGDVEGSLSVGELILDSTLAPHRRLLAIWGEICYRRRRG